MGRAGWDDSEGGIRLGEEWSGVKVEWRALI